MTLLESLSVAAIALVLSLKIYSAYRKANWQRTTPVDTEDANQEARDSQRSDIDLAEAGSTDEVRLDWGEIFLIIVSLTICVPLGLVFLWKTDKLDSKTKNYITILYLSIIGMVVLIKIGSS